MSKSKGRSAGQGGAGRRLQTIGLFVTLLAVAVLVGSLAAGLAGGGSTVADEPWSAAPSTPPRAPPSTTAASAAPVRVAVLNASGIPRLADRGRARLRDDGRFDVKEIGNAPGFSPDSSVVLDRVRQVGQARAVADALGISRVESRPDANLYLDVTVVLGKDWAARNPERPASTAQ
ncbi:MAG TPA: LytR C-terminal domain-containing protein [Longimicrobium sp.]|jgi:hypothetical protein|uniref:LytR C-terminal domain-containing protein n=1 Tax=Longimicrobium sp. TaxID=2029185 RepID=UPI002EDB3744